MKRVLIWLMVLCSVFGVARAEDIKFSVGASLTGSGRFNGSDTGLPGDIGVAVQVEAWNVIADQVGIRARVGSSWIEAGVQWHLDLSSQVNIVFGLAVGYFWADTWALFGNAGLEYHPAWLQNTILEPITFFFEYGLSSYSVNNITNLRSSLALGILFFL
jgi:hypothetical protein